jgi:hypothetical protein
LNLTAQPANNDIGEVEHMWDDAKVTIDEGPYVRSMIDLEAPRESPYEYLNHAISPGTLFEQVTLP